MLSTSLMIDMATDLRFSDQLFISFLRVSRLMCISFGPEKIKSIPLCLLDFFLLGSLLACSMFAIPQKSIRWTDINFACVVKKLLP